MVTRAHDPQFGYHQRLGHHEESPALVARGQDHRRRLGNYTCQQCGSWYSRRQDRPGSFCSTRCLGDSRKKRTVCQCRFCGQQFESVLSVVQRGEALYCSRKCLLAAGHVQLVCPTCGEPFQVLRHKITRRKTLYCSGACTPSGRVPTNDTPPRWCEGLVCCWCGAGFTGTKQQEIHRKRGGTIYCSSECRRQGSAQKQQENRQAKTRQARKVL